MSDTPGEAHLANGFFRCALCTQHTWEPALGQKRWPSKTLAHRVRSCFGGQQSSVGRSQSRQMSPDKQRKVQGSPTTWPTARGTAGSRQQQPPSRAGAHQGVGRSCPTDGREGGCATHGALGHVEAGCQHPPAMNAGRVDHGQRETQCQPTLRSPVPEYQPLGSGWVRGCAGEDRGGMAGSWGGRCHSAGAARGTWTLLASSFWRHSHHR